MKIAVIGTHGVGKSYFSANLYAHLLKSGRNVTLIEELSRNCPLPMNENTTKRAQAWILFDQMVREIEEEKRHEIVICDRGVVDNYAYFVRAHGDSRDLDPVVKYWLPTYDTIYKIRSTTKYLMNDGFRSTSEEWQREMDGRLTSILKDFGVKYVELDSGDWEDAAGSILKSARKN